ncbi:GNAT family N-acetyltransferase [Methanomassiliicoccus luminyensis]|uniref:GNAT family N-acetyltransferase n=1 Tax=Methanomassiliicoccus luminyensis TaxID=1080712 RepID=UPI00138AB798|nr:GNAT family N-acetyltransferase [Methanomassiliicoccus luminyensis]
MAEAAMIETVSREMTRRDLPQVLNMSRENMAHIIFTSWGVEWRDEDLLRILLEPSAFTEVLEADGRIIAYYSVDVRNDNLFINSIQVLRGYQGLGLGGEMMQRIEAIAHARGLLAIELWVQITNREATRFYRHTGYKLISRQGNNYLMRKVLEGPYRRPSEPPTQDRCNY